MLIQSEVESPFRNRISRRQNPPCGAPTFFIKSPPPPPPFRCCCSIPVVGLVGSAAQMPSKLIKNCSSNSIFPSLSTLINTIEAPPLNFALNYFMFNSAFITLIVFWLKKLKKMKKVKNSEKILRYYVN